MNIPDFDIDSLLAAYREGASPVAVVTDIYRRIRAAGDNPVWISLTPEALAMEFAQALADDPQARGLPLFGIPFAVKDNIDVAGLETTAACQSFAYSPGQSATAVQRLLAAGAICIGKTNLDQFATGLVGSRSPYGAVRNALHSAYLSGGSSSGSAVAVALGQVSFSLGTDTAGSGRIPAAFNNIVGLKPSCGRVSTAGVVPACRSLDCVSIFAGSCADAETVLNIIEGFDEQDPYSRHMAGHAVRGSQPVFGIPRKEQLQWFGDSEFPDLFNGAVARLESRGARIVVVDFTPFLEAGRLLYDGPWVAERYAAIRDFFQDHPRELLPVTRDIIGSAGRYSAADTFQAQYRLAALKSKISPLWRDIDALCIPTAGTIYSTEAEKREPMLLNSNLGLYTNFANLLDLAAIAVPAAKRADGLPFGISLVGPAGSDHWLCRIGADFHASTGLPVGATPSMPGEMKTFAAAVAGKINSPPARIEIAVVGAHLSGEPLNHQLTERGARLVRAARTAPRYSLFALPDSVPPKPGLLRAPDDAGTTVELEVWELDESGFGSFVAAIPPPLCIGTLELEDGSSVKGFLCEAHAINKARNISSFGGWRAYLKAESNR
jgi:allophanate hydrolase